MPRKPLTQWQFATLERLVNDEIARLQRNASFQNETVVESLKVLSDELAQASNLILDYPRKR